MLKLYKNKSLSVLQHYYDQITLDDSLAKTWHEKDKQIFLNRGNDMCHIRKIIFIFFGIILLVFGGCAVSKDVLESRDVAFQCVEKDENTLVIMYDICVINDITGIGLSSVDSVWITYKNNDRFYFTPGQESDDNAATDSNVLLQAYNILNKLYRDYGINDFHYYPNDSSMEIRFLKNSRAILYSPVSKPSKDVNAEEIKNSFYTYMLKGMF